MKLLHLLTLVVLFSTVFTACTTAPNTTDTLTEPNEIDHIGCQEGEISIDGTCTIAPENNVDIFDVSDIDEHVQISVIEQENGLRGVYVEPATPGNHPGVLMIHEWWGLNENIIDMAKLTAREGYRVFAIDLYDGQVATESDDARVYATQVRENPDEAVRKMKLANEYLRAQGAQKVASLGWCFGGQQSLQASLHDEIDATIIYYGNLVEDKDQLQTLQGPVLGIFGSEDQSIPVSSVQNFESALEEVGVQKNIHIYDGVGHAFANPSGSNYAADETRDAWSKTLDFLSANLYDATSIDSALIDSTDLTAQADHVFSISGENFKYTMDGEDNPTLTVQSGDTVQVEFTSTSGFHDWVVDEFDAATAKVRSGEGTASTTSVTFVADKPGEYEYYCSVGSHRANGMRGTLIVE